MIFASEIPELTDHPRGFPSFWLKTIFLDELDSNFAVKALISNYVRLVEAAYQRYREARAGVLAYVDREDMSSVPIGAFIKSCSDFEDCISHTHRAIRCMKGIRGRSSVPATIKALFSPKPTFMTKEDRVRRVRDAVQHTYDMVFDGTITSDSPFTLAAAGREEPDPNGKPNQVLKTWDRIQIGTESITFIELHSWLVEMGGCAEKLAQR